ncbi:hypothetical protein A2U01_0013580 [Trifolium medium]|uniref:Uncharacterized protein n=1 Tax=Trifolium medium TaxID=97028 RepID=A0A392MYN8_9FABA|nr:hypothetical protein [Trifolium medium]
MSEPNSSSHSPLTPTEEQPPQRRRSQRLMQRQKEQGARNTIVSPRKSPMIVSDDGNAAALTSGNKRKKKEPVNSTGNPILDMMSTFLQILLTDTKYTRYRKCVIGVVGFFTVLYYIPPFINNIKQLFGK